MKITYFGFDSKDIKPNCCQKPILSKRTATNFLKPQQGIFHCASVDHFHQIRPISAFSITGAHWNFDSLLEIPVQHRQYPDAKKTPDPSKSPASLIISLGLDSVELKSSFCSVCRFGMAAGKMR
ncbi:hypothetical protein BdWA1_000706 [Babesia duncani]|uniref:Uncharacterized protein n=1 Tax=Babesia duncani TaxID=323732 RepID=A0AAD9PMV9_9APIC|nr:hypothetical protein BdWA1_000706 [Babesia duncani]